MKQADVDSRAFIEDLGDTQPFDSKSTLAQM